MTTPTVDEDERRRLSDAAFFADPRLRWRVIGTDNYTNDGIAPVCPHQDDYRYHSTGDGYMKPPADLLGVYDCCPFPHLETGSVPLAARLVELLNANTQPPGPRVWKLDTIPGTVKGVRDRNGDRWTSIVSPQGIRGWYHRGEGLAKSELYMIAYYGPVTEEEEPDPHVPTES